MVKKYVCIPRRFLVINVCNQGKTLFSPCINDINGGITGEWLIKENYEGRNYNPIELWPDITWRKWGKRWKTTDLPLSWPVLETCTSRIQVQNVTATLTVSSRMFLWCQSRSINIICTAYGEKNRLEFSHLKVEKTSGGTVHFNRHYLGLRETSRWILYWVMN